MPWSYEHGAEHLRPKLHAKDEFPEIHVLMSRRADTTIAFGRIFNKGRIDPQFTEFILCEGLPGGGKSMLAAIIATVLMKNPAYRVCLYKCFPELLDWVTKKWQQHGMPEDWWKKRDDQAPNEHGRAYIAETINDIRPYSFIWVDEGLLAMHALTAGRTIMRKLAGFLAQLRQKHCTLFVGAQTALIVAELRRHATIAIYKRLGEGIDTRDVHDRTARAYIAWLMDNRSKQLSIVRAGALGGVGMIEITKEMCVKWWDDEISSYMEHLASDLEQQTEDRAIAECIEVANHFFEDNEEDGVTPERLTRVDAGWVRAYYQRHDAKFLYRICNGNRSYLTDLTNHLRFVARKLAWAAEDTPDEDAEDETEQDIEIDATAATTAPDDVSFGQFLRKSLAGHHMHGSSISAQIEHQIVASIADGQSQRAVELATKVKLAAVNAVWQFYWGKVKGKKQHPTAPQELQVWKLYELWDCFKTGGKHGGGNGEPDVILPDGRAGTCKCYYERIERLTFSILKDFGPEIKWALEHGQTTIRVSIRNIYWIKDHPDCLDYTCDAFPIDHHPDGSVVDDKVILDPTLGFLRPNGTPFFVAELTS